MSFLDELEEQKNTDAQKNSDKTSRELFESCFKYFKHFVTILQKDKSTFDVEFNFIFLNLISDCLITGPFEIKRAQDDKELKLEITFFTQLKDNVAIKRKDQRSAELLRVKLSKDNILSGVKIDKNNIFYTELNNTIPSVFRILLKNETDFYVEYRNVGISTNRSIKLPIEKVNQDYMDQLAKYILGKNPSLYRESISNKEISKIRDKIALEKSIIAKRKEKTKAILEQERIQEEIRIANTLKEKSKKYVLQQSHRLKNTILDKTNNLKNKIRDKINDLKSK